MFICTCVHVCVCIGICTPLSVTKARLVSLHNGHWPMGGHPTILAFTIQMGLYCFPGP